MSNPFGSVPFGFLGSGLGVVLAFPSGLAAALSCSSATSASIFNSSSTILDSRSFLVALFEAATDRVDGAGFIYILISRRPPAPESACQNACPSKPNG